MSYKLKDIQELLDWIVENEDELSVGIEYQPNRLIVFIVPDYRIQDQDRIREIRIRFENEYYNEQETFEIGYKKVFKNLIMLKEIKKEYEQYQSKINKLEKQLLF